MSSREIKNKTKISDYIETAMERKKIGIREVAEALDVTYEHIRSSLRGIIVPSPYIVERMCAFFGEDADKWEKIAVLDRIERTHGFVPREDDRKYEDLAPIERYWPNLSAEHKQDIIAMAAAFAKRDRLVSKN